VRLHEPDGHECRSAVTSGPSPEARRLPDRQFAVVFGAEAVGSRAPCPDGLETSEAAWVDPEHVEHLAVEPGMRIRILDALSTPEAPHLDPTGRSNPHQLEGTLPAHRLSWSNAQNLRTLPGDAPGVLLQAQVLDGNVVVPPVAASLTEWVNHLVDMVRREVSDAAGSGMISLAESEQLLARIILVVDQSLMSGEKP
jgi:hypothetical protein